MNEKSSFKKELEENKLKLNKKVREESYKNKNLDSNVKSPSEYFTLDKTINILQKEEKYKILKEEKFIFYFYKIILLLFMPVPFLLVTMKDYNFKSKLLVDKFLSMYSFTFYYSVFLLLLLLVFIIICFKYKVKNIFKNIFNPIFLIPIISCVTLVHLHIIAIFKESISKSSLLFKIKDSSIFSIDGYKLNPLIIRYIMVFLYTSFVVAFVLILLKKVHEFKVTKESDLILRNREWNKAKQIDDIK